MIVIVSTSLRAGYRRGLQTVMGTGLAVIRIEYWSALAEMLAMLLDSCYALLAYQAGGLLRSKSTPHTVNGATGTIYLMASALLAGSRQH